MTTVPLRDMPAQLRQIWLIRLAKRATRQYVKNEPVHEDFVIWRFAKGAVDETGQRVKMRLNVLVDRIHQIDVHILEML